MRKIFRTISTSLILGVTPLIVAAQDPITADPSAIPSVVPGGKALLKDDITAIFESLRDWFAGIVVIIAIIAILYGAALYLTAGGNEDKLTKAKQVILYGAVGILIAIIAYGVFGLIASFLD